MNIKLYGFWPSQISYNSVSLEITTTDAKEPNVINSDIGLVTISANAFKGELDKMETNI